MFGLVKGRWTDRVSREGVNGKKLGTLVIALLCQLFLQGLAVAVPDYLQERDGHGENHPDVNHLNIGRCRKRTRDSNMAANSDFVHVNLAIRELIVVNYEEVALISTHNVARTRRAVRLTPMTMSK